jgi:hypothetical protein
MRGGDMYSEAVTQRIPRIQEVPCYNLDLDTACAHGGFLLGLLLDPEDGGDNFLQSVTMFVIGSVALTSSNSPDVLLPL